MQDKEWIIEQVSQEPAREWNNPKGGIVYYKKVKLAGHDKPVSVGKKDPSVLQPGGKLSGHIEVNMSDAEDKFKPAPMGFVANSQSQQGGAFQQTSTNTGQAGFSKPAYKDNSDGQRQGMCFNNAANFVNQLLKDVDPQQIEPNKWSHMVHEYANALYKLGDLGSDGGSTSDSLKVQTSPTTSKPWQVDTRKPDAKLWPSDKDDAEAVSLYQTYVDAEELPYDMQDLMG